MPEFNPSKEERARDVHVQKIFVIVCASVALIVLYVVAQDVVFLRWGSIVALCGCINYLFHQWSGLRSLNPIIKDQTREACKSNDATVAQEGAMALSLVDSDSRSA